MQVTRILHASVNHASAPDETARFYAEVLGMPPSPFRPDIPGVPGHWFEAGNAQVHLVGFPSSDGAIDPTRHHVCFGVADLDAAVAELEARGVAFVRGAQDHPGGRVHQVFFTDPAGNTIELQADPA